MTTKELIDLFEKEYQANSNRANANQMRAYMKDQYPFVGIKAPLRKELFRSHWKNHKSLIINEYQDIVTKLWNKPERDYQMLALEVLSKSQKQLSVFDLPFLEKLIITKSWWDTIDFLASNSVAYILKGNTKLQTEVTNKFFNSGNMWLQRTALLFQLKYKDQTDQKLLFELIRRTFGSKEFFINKASGWALRQFSKFEPGVVKDFINVNRENLSNLTIREGSKYL